MRVFIAGATGAIGRPLVRRLVERGHAVTGMTRSPRRAAWLASVGATPVVCDAFDRHALREAVAEARPDAVIDQLTSMPRRPAVLHFARFYRGQIPLRREGSRALLEAAAAAGARRLIVQSVAFMYAPGADQPPDEFARPYLDAPAPWDVVIPMTVAMERQALAARGLEAAVLRYGFLYGPGTYFASDGFLAELTRRRHYPVIGDGAGRFPFIHVDDAADATVAALERGVFGVFNVVDDRPTPVREWLPTFARRLGAAPPLRIPKSVARVVAGAIPTHWATELPGASNAKAKDKLRWRPRYPSFEQGIQEALG